MSGSESFKITEKFNLKILPFSTKEGEEIQSKKVLLVFEDLKTLAAKSSPGSLTLKQFKKRLYVLPNPKFKTVHLTNVIQSVRRAILQ
jgi:hypothetical protein